MRKYLTFAELSTFIIISSLYLFNKTWGILRSIAGIQTSSMNDFVLFQKYIG